MIFLWYMIWGLEMEELSPSTAESSALKQESPDVCTLLSQMRWSEHNCQPNFTMPAALPSDNCLGAPEAAGMSPKP